MASGRVVVRGKGRRPAAAAADPAHASVFTSGACRHSAAKVAVRTHIRQRSSAMNFHNFSAARRRFALGLNGHLTAFHRKKRICSVSIRLI
jgi:hypothetical protein